MRRVFAFFTLAPLQLVPAALALDARSDAYELMLVCRLVELRGGVPPRGRRHARWPFTGPEAAVGVRTRMIVRAQGRMLDRSECERAIAQSTY